MAMRGSSQGFGAPAAALYCADREVVSITAVGCF